jgi:hypothetical protein
MAIVFATQNESVPSKEPSNEQALLLKALITYLTGVNSHAFDAIAALAADDHPGMSKSEMVTVARSFVRLNARTDALNDGRRFLTKAALNFAARTQTPLPPEMQAVCRRLSDNNQFDEGFTTPFFVDTAGIASFIETLSPKQQQVFTSYAGFWRLYRFSTDAMRPKLVNRSFMMIKFKDTVDSPLKSAPRFSLYARHGRNRDGRAKLAGHVFPLSERLTFVGARLGAFNQHLFSMVWTIDEGVFDTDGFPTHAHGLSLGPNGLQAHIASYVYAKRIVGTEELVSGPDYERLRDEEIAAVHTKRFDLMDDQDNGLLAAEIGEEGLGLFLNIHEEARAISIG